MANDAQLLIVLEAQSKKLQNQLVAATKTIDRFAAQTNKRFDQMNAKNAASFDRLAKNMNSSLGGVRGAIAPLIGALGVREITGYADAWIQAGNKIASASTVAGLQARSLDALKESANGARTELTEYVDLYARLLRTAPQIAATELEIAKATDVVAKSLKAGGASAQEQQASLIQLGQALGSGVLQGDELRSLRENAPLVAQAIAKEFGVSIGELKALGAEGKLTSERVFQALLSAADDVEAAFASTRSTVRDAFARLENEFIAFIGNADSATGATAGLIDALNYLADNFEEVAGVVAQFVTLLIGALAGRAIAGVVISLGQAVIALGGFLTALRAGTLAAGTFTAALGPIGLIAGAAAAAMILLWQNQEDARRTAEAHTQAITDTRDALDLARDSSDAFRVALQKQIALQLTAAQAALTEAKAQLQANVARAQIATMLNSNPITAPFAQGAGAAFTSMAYTNAAAITDNERFIAELKKQLAEIDNIRLTPPGTGDRGVPSGGSGAGSGSDKKNEYERAVEAIQKREAALRAEIAAQATLNPLVNDYGYAVERAKAMQDLLTAAQEAGVTVTPELRKEMESLADGYAYVTVAGEKLQEKNAELVASFEGIRDTSKDVFRGFIDDLVAGTSAAEILANALGKIGSKLLDMGIDSLFGGGGGSNPFGIIGQALGFRESGGPVTAGKPYVVGEKRPELFVPNSSGRIIPQVPNVMSQGGGGTTVHAPVSITIDATGADAAGLARVEQRLAQLKGELPGLTVKAVRDAKKRGVKL
jgi:tape measure domain-containing protein